MNKFSHLKYLTFFIFTFSLGFGLTKAGSNLNIQNNGFSQEEAISHLYKKVQSLCNAKFVSVEETKGETSLVNNLNGEVFVLVHWDYSLRGRHELIWYSKEEYEKCLVEVGEVER